MTQSHLSFGVEDLLKNRDLDRRRNTLNRKANEVREKKIETLPTHVGFLI